MAVNTTGSSLATVAAAAHVLKWLLSHGEGAEPFNGVETKNGLLAGIVLQTLTKHFCNRFGLYCILPRPSPSANVLAMSHHGFLVCLGFFFVCLVCLFFLPLLFLSQCDLLYSMTITFLALMSLLPLSS